VTEAEQFSHDRDLLLEELRMGLEIERKFLVKHEGWKLSVTRSMRIRDGLIAASNGNKARVRIADDVATIAVKGRRRGRYCAGRCRHPCGAK